LVRLNPVDMDVLQDVQTEFSGLALTLDGRFAGNPGGA
jgi:hypothetical protein